MLVHRAKDVIDRVISQVIIHAARSSIYDLFLKIDTISFTHILNQMFTPNICTTSSIIPTNLS